MPHGMLGTMHEAADHGRGKPRPSDGADLTESHRIDLSQVHDGHVDASA